MPEMNSAPAMGHNKANFTRQEKPKNVNGAFSGKNPVSLARDSDRRAQINHSLSLCINLGRTAKLCKSAEKTTLT